MSRKWIAPLLVLASLATPRLAAAQGGPAGRVVGRIVDSETGRGLPGAQVVVQGLRLGTIAGVDGRYIIAGVPSGTQALQVSYIGYGSKTVTGIEVPSGSAASMDVTLSPAAVELQGITVSAERERGTVSRALDEQRTAIGVVNAVSSEQIARSPDSDAAQAVQRVSGVTVQDGKFVFVRGLGERYTTTSLNGARIPSPEPERKVVPLDLFPSGLLQTIATSKTFTADQPGDFSGASVNIRTREFPARPQVTFSVSGGANTAVTGQPVFSAPVAGLELLALGQSDRELPLPVVEAGNFSPAPSPQQVNQIINSFRDAWSVSERDGKPNGSVALSVGGSNPFLGRRFGYLASGTYSYSQEVRANEIRAYADPTGGTREIDRFEGQTGRESVLWGGLLNLSTLLGTSSRISFNNTYNRTADNDARREAGIDENLGLPLRIDRLQYVERSIRSNQLAGEHELGARNRVDWSLTSSGVTRDEPDRSEVVYGFEGDPASGVSPALLLDPQAAVRTFGSLEENSWEAAGNYRLNFGDPAREHAIKVGGLFRATDRDSDNRSYSIQVVRPENVARELTPEEIFGGRFTDGTASNFRVVPLNRGGSYTAEDRLLAGYGMVEYALTDRLRLIAGARVERSDVQVDAEPTIGAPVVAEPSYTDVLPSLTANVRLTDEQSLRFSASQTLSRPEYRELAPIGYRDVIGGETVIGNAELRRTLIQNYDARWEWYPQLGEVLSFGVFAKRFQDPIERVYLGTSGTRVVTFVNADQATNYGVELEARKDLSSFAPLLQGFGAFANATLMRSKIDVDESNPLQTNANRRMVGQAPYVINTGLTYTTPGESTSATLLFNTVGERVVGAAEPPLPNVIEEPRISLDFSLRFALTDALSGKFDAKNLLNEPYKVTQGTVTREFYETGRIFSVGLTWRQ